MLGSLPSFARLQAELSKLPGIGGKDSDPLGLLPVAQFRTGCCQFGNSVIGDEKERLLLPALFSYC